MKTLMLNPKSANQNLRVYAGSPRKRRPRFTYHLLHAEHKFPNPAPKSPFTPYKDSDTTLTNQLMPSVTSWVLLTLV